MSLQLNAFLAALASDIPLEQASAASGIPMEEARLWEEAIASGEVELPKIERENDMTELTVAGDHLRLFMERIARLEEEKKGISDDIADVYEEAKQTGYDTKTMRRIRKLQKMSTHQRQEAEALMGCYLNALGLTPIEQAIALAA